MDWKVEGPALFLRNDISAFFIALHYITLHYITIRGTIFIHSRGVITVVHTLIPKKAQSASTVSANNTWDKCSTGNFLYCMRLPVSGEPEAKSDTDNTTICDKHNAYYIHITKVW